MTISCMTWYYYDNDIMCYDKHIITWQYGWNIALIDRNIKKQWYYKKNSVTCYDNNIMRYDKNIMGYDSYILWYDKNIITWQYGRNIAWNDKKIITWEYDKNTVTCFDNNIMRYDIMTKRHLIWLKVLYFPSQLMFFA